MSDETRRALTDVYKALGKHDPATFLAKFTDDIEFNVVRSLPVQRHRGKADAAAYLQRTLQWTPNDADIELEYFAADGDVGFSIHVEAKGTPREHRHVMIWKFDGDRVRELWELNLGGPPSLQGVDIEALERAGCSVLVLEGSV